MPYGNASSQAETSIAKIHQQATWLQQMSDPRTPLGEGMGKGITDRFSSSFRVV